MGETGHPLAADLTGRVAMGTAGTNGIGEGAAALWVTGVTIPVDGGITAAAGRHRDRDGQWQLTP